MSEKKCSVENCNHKYYSKGYCNRHYWNYKKYNNPLGRIKEIRVCKNPECKNEFVAREAKHLYCCEVCKQSHYKSIGKTDEIMRRFNKSAKGKARTERYLQSEKGKIYNRNKSARHKERNPSKNLARIEAVKHLEEKPCSVNGCGQPGERHHHDYSKPLDVVYLCKKHHMDLHNNRLCLN